MENNNNINDFLKLNKEKQVEILLNIKNKEELNRFLKQIQKKNRGLFAKLKGALQSNKQIRSIIKPEQIELVVNQQLVTKLNINDITPNPYQPRKSFNDKEIQELADSILENGLIQPILVAKQNKTNFILIAGERRLRAYKLLSKSNNLLFDEIEVKIIEDVSDNRLKILSLLENLDRVDLSLRETVMSFKELSKDGHTIMEISKMTSKSKSVVGRYIKISKLDSSVLSKMEEYNIQGANIMEEIAKLTDVNTQLLLLTEYKNGLVYKELVKKVSLLLNTKKNKKYISTVGAKQAKTIIDSINTNNRKISAAYKKLDDLKKGEADIILADIIKLQDKLILNI